jgi:N-acetylneuraminic acid mutarotase
MGNKTPMPSKRLGMQANIVKNKIYLIGGSEWLNETSGADSSRNEVYDTVTDKWTTKASIPMPVSFYASAVVGNKIYIITSILTQIYDTESDKWSTGAVAPLALILPSAGATKGMFATELIYMFGADADMPYYQLTTRQFTIQSYDPQTNNWTVCDSMPTGRFNTGLAALNGSLYVIGGFTLEGGGSWPDIFPSNIPSAMNEQYTPAEQVPEFPSWIVLPLLLMVPFVVLIYKKRLL